jgi:hypothetical protein
MNGMVEKRRKGEGRRGRGEGGGEKGEGIFFFMSNQLTK